ncbi:hypothetical protein OH76DRAFT_1556432 [Lentinus brumalis]|uniref:Uncharacterized protein n=1 Tax=Lentinus brumalis TaxID=2498619 RepID=A0A371DAE9_9APHY|nr:hypothetical protein OH76DRAFT_1556432 [Polyporus brumalis]
MNEHQAESPQEQHSIFQGMTASTPDPTHERRMTIGLPTAAFTASSLLHAVKRDETIWTTSTFAQDVESIGYVILYSLYKHAVEDSQVSDDLRAELSKEFTGFFSAANITGLLTNRALRFRHDAEESMQYLIAYLDNDTALVLCAAATFNFLSNLNQVKEPRNDSLDPILRMVEQELPTPRGMPFVEAYPLWIEILREAALELPGAQGSAS